MNNTIPMKTLVYLLVVGLLTVAAAAQTAREKRWINRLKSTPASAIDPEAPKQRFGQWLAALVKPETPKYEVNDCGERQGTAEERGKQFPLCVTVTANVPALRQVELRFVVGTYVVPATGSKAAKEKAAEVKLFSGMIGPSDPRSKQPTRVIRKLSELDKMLK